jgi:glutamate/tyrosine decarboxylase-like PLP-dependent enzyme
MLDQRDNHMKRTSWRPLLESTADIATQFLESLPERPVGARQGPAEMLAALDRPLQAEPTEPQQVIEELARVVEPGLTGMPSGRFFGWVIGGGLPAAVAADWLTTVWDQNAGSADGTPAAATIEHVVLRWITDLLELPAASGALVTGAQMANFVGLAAGRAEVLRRAGWSIDVDGLVGAPPIEVFIGAERHGTIDRALRMLGFGTRQIRVIEADREGRMRVDQLDLAGDQPAIVCAQLGNVNGGGCDSLVALDEHVQRARKHRPVWLHVDGAFGLWARVAPARRALVEGVERADSWATDAHKWLNTPYDCGIALLRDADAHRRTFAGGASYLPGDAIVPNPFDRTPELSRRARGFALWAALRGLGRSGVTDLVERCCSLAQLFARELSTIPGVEIMNEVSLNQLVVRFRDPTGRDHDAHTRAVVAGAVADGVCFPSVTTWRGSAAMRLSLSNWSTDEDDVRKSVAAIAAVHGR